MIKLSETREERVDERKKNRDKKDKDDRFKELIPSPRGVKPERKDLQRKKKFVPKEAAQDDYQYATLSVPVPQKYHAQLKSIQKSIDPKYLTHNGFEDTFHVTVYYGLNNTDADKIGPIMSQYVLNKSGAPNTIFIKTNGFGSFMENDNFDVLTLRVQSDELSTIHYIIEKELSPSGNDYIVYRPHITLAYLKKSTPGIDLPAAPKFSWATSIVQFMRTDSNDIPNREILISNNENIITRAKSLIII